MTTNILKAMDTNTPDSTTPNPRLKNTCVMHALKGISGTLNQKILSMEEKVDRDGETKVIQSQNKEKIGHRLMETLTHLDDS